MYPVGVRPSSPRPRGSPLSPPRLLVLGGLLLAGPACVRPPTPMPAEEAVQGARSRDEQPALYQLLYHPALAPSALPVQQRVRMLIWIRHMDLSDAQLQQLEALRQLVLERKAQIERAERELAEKGRAREEQLYGQLWERLSAGAPADAPEVLALTTELRALQEGSERERELLKTRIEGIRAILDAERPFLASLSPRQEALLSDALFFLRNHLDPIANPGDFRALVGTTYEAGQYAVLSRGTTRWARDPLNIGGLWSDEPPLAGGALHEARREALLYLAVLEPGMDEAIRQARQMRAREIELQLVDELSPEAAPASGEPPAAPEAPPPGAEPVTP